MNKKRAVMNRLVCFCCVFILMFGVLAAGAAFGADAVNVILKNNSSGSVDVELIDQYGGNFTASVDAGMGSSQTLKNGSEIKVNGATVHTVSDADEGKEIVIAN